MFKFETTNTHEILVKIRTVLQPIAAYEMTTEIMNVAFPESWHTIWDFTVCFWLTWNFKFWWTKHLKINLLCYCTFHVHVNIWNFGYYFVLQKFWNFHDKKSNYPATAHSLPCSAGANWEMSRAPQTADRPKVATTTKFMIINLHEPLELTWVQ